MFTEKYVPKSFLKIHIFKSYENSLKKYSLSSKTLYQIEVSITLTLEELGNGQYSSRLPQKFPIMIEIIFHIIWYLT